MAKDEHWWHSFEDVVFSGFADYLTEEENAVFRREFTTTTLPWVVQTQRYARHIIASFQVEQVSEGYLNRSVEFRIARQWRLLERPNPPKFEFVVDEGALRRRIGGREVLREQLRHVQTVLEAPNVSLNVLPFSAGIVLPYPDFHLFYNEQKSGWVIFFEDSSDIWRCDLGDKWLRALWAKLHEHALSVADSRALIESIIHELDNETNETEIDARTSSSKHSVSA